MSRAAAVLIARGESPRFSQKIERSEAENFFGSPRLRRATRNQVGGGSANANCLAFARASDLPIFCESRAAEICPGPLRQFLQFKLRFGSQMWLFRWSRRCCCLHAAGKQRRRRQIPTN
jgi:hypothetical protein